MKTVHYEHARIIGGLLGPDAQGITFMASNFSIIRFLCACSRYILFQRNRGEIMLSLLRVALRKQEVNYAGNILTRSIKFN